MVVPIEKMGRKYAALINRKRILQEEDHTNSHITRPTKENIKELEAIKISPNQAYSPDLAPPDHHLFDK